MRNLQFEQLLQNVGLTEGKGEHTYHYVDRYPLAKINRPKSLQNHARLEAPLLEDTVERYTQSVKDGEDFPAIGLHEVRGQGVIDDGNHRVEAYHRANVKTISAYVINTDDKHLRQIIYTANAKHGTPLSRPEMIQHAYDLHIRDSIPIKNLAKVFHINVSTLMSEIRQRHVIERLSAFGVDGKKFTKTHTDVIHSILDLDDAVLTSITKTAVESNVGADELRRLCATIRKTTPTSQRPAIIAHWKERVQQRAALTKLHTKGKTVGEFETYLRKLLAASDRMLDLLKSKQLDQISTKKDKALVGTSLGRIQRQIETVCSKTQIRVRRAS